MKSYPLSIIIPCCDDLLLEKCVASIDCDVEIIVSLNNPSKEIISLCKKLKRVKVVASLGQGIASAYNQGINASANNWVLLMDSDCTFKNNSIASMWQLTKCSEIIKGKIVFLRSNPMTLITSQLREFTTSDSLNAYSPPLLFNKSIVKKIGYYFHPNLIWSEDADFNQRIQKAKIPISYCPQGEIFHHELSFRTDLKSAFHYGIGREVGKRLKIYQSHSFKNFLKNLFNLFIDFWRIIFKKNVLAALYYLLFWKPAFYFGTWYEKLFKINKGLYEK
jgi:GT2 family glycosyltransferase